MSQGPYMMIDESPLSIPSNQQPNFQVDTRRYDWDTGQNYNDYEDPKDRRIKDLERRIGEKQAEFDGKERVLRDTTNNLQEKVDYYQKALEETGTCKHMLDHMQGCDVCSSFMGYKNRYYIIIIVILLTIVIVLLMKLKSKNSSES